LARAHHRAGRLAEAEALYRRILAADPHHAEGLHLLGVIAHQAGRPDAAVRLIGKAIERSPRVAMFHYNLGNAFTALGRHRQAAQSYGRAVELKGDFVEARKNLAVAYNNLGTAVQSQGNGDEAERCFRRALAADPELAVVHSNLGAALHDQGRLTDALASYHEALRLDPTLAEAHAWLGTLFLAEGQLGAAETAFHRALALQPDHAEAWYDLGILLRQQGVADAVLSHWQRALACNPDLVEALRALWTLLREAGRLGEAMAQCRGVLAVRPANAEAHFALGELYLASRELEAAAASYQRALDSGADNADVLSGLGLVYSQLGRPEEAEGYLRRALDRDPDSVEALANLAELLPERGAFDEAVALGRRAIALAPSHFGPLSALTYLRACLCDWRDLAADQQRLLVGVRAGAPWISPYGITVQPSSAADQLAAARTWAAAVSGGEGPPAAMPRPAGKLRLGYVSGDLRDHPVGHVAADLFERHDRQRFELIAYSYGADDGSETRRRLAAAFDGFVDIASLSHDAAARRISGDGIDILIDLTGHTKNGRPGILAHRPAPVQVNYLGYPGTLGAPFVDYIIADRFVAPVDQQPFYSERLVHLPGSFFPTDSKRVIAAATPSRAECGLPDHGFVFCCFNAPQKIAEAMFDVWMRLLAAHPDSVLWLSQVGEAARRNLEREAGERGITANRLTFAEPVPSLAAHLARYRLADLFLDTLPYNAHATASDALSAGLPVLTCAGETFAGRVAGSLLHAVGLSELIAGSLADYEGLAGELVSRPDRLADIRARLQAARASAPLFDSERYTRGLEAAFLHMQARRLAGEEPQAFGVGDDLACTPL
jgi:predicted O-linked N-acetylglucosamine transferase (SPINDLY family)